LPLSTSPGEPQWWISDKRKIAAKKNRPPEDAPVPVVGNDVPDESKERHTEIAVDVGRTIGEKHK
jgi:hypothetical protein